MSYPCTDDPNEILEYVVAAKTNASKFNKFVNGSSAQTVQLGDGDPTPTLRKFIADAQSVVATAANEAAETVLDDVADMMVNKVDKFSRAVSGNIAKFTVDGNIVDSGRAVHDFVLLLAYANDEALNLALLNRMNVEVYEEWYARGIAHLEAANIDAMKAAESIRALIDAFDESYAQHRLQKRLFDGTNPGASSKPVLFIVCGQSNAVGGGEYTPFDQALDCGQFWSWKDGANMLKPIKDPTGNYTTRGSGWPAFARRFFALTGRKIILLNVAFGGSAVTDGGYDTANTWADNGYGTLRAQTEGIWNAFSAAVPSSSYDLGCIFWVQGEAEASRIYAGTVTAQDYKDGTLDVWNWLWTLIGVPDVLIAVGKVGRNITSTYNATAKAAYDAIHKAQDELCASTANVEMLFSMAPHFADAWDEYMLGSIHYSPVGYRVQGSAFARSAVNYLNF